MLLIVSLLSLLVGSALVEAFLAVPGQRLSRTLLAAKKTHKVTVQHAGVETVLEVREDVSILSAALEAGVELPHDCELGVCLTCPSRIVSGDVDQTGGTLDDSVMQQVRLVISFICFR